MKQKQSRKQAKGESRFTAKMRAYGRVDTEKTDFRLGNGTLLMENPRGGERLLSFNDLVVVVAKGDGVTMMARVLDFEGGQRGGGGFLWPLEYGFPGLAMAVAEDARNLSAGLALELAAEPYLLVEAGFRDNLGVLLEPMEDGWCYWDFVAGSKADGRLMAQSFAKALTNLALDRLAAGDPSLLDLLPEAGVSLQRPDGTPLGTSELAGRMRA